MRAKQIKRPSLSALELEWLVAHFGDYKKKYELWLLRGQPREEKKESNVRHSAEEKIAAEAL